MGFVMKELFGYGVIGLVYEGSGGAALAYIVFFLFAILALLGAFTIIKALIKLILFGRKKKMTPEEKWLKTGKF